MEYFIFIFFKCKDLWDLNYINGNIYIFIKFIFDGLLIIFDKDILFYCGLLLMDQINKGNILFKILCILSYDFLVAINCFISGEGY